MSYDDQAIAEAEKWEEDNPIEQDCVVHNSYYDIDMKVVCEDCGEFLGTWSYSELDN